MKGRMFAEKKEADSNNPEIRRLLNAKLNPGETKNAILVFSTLDLVKRDATIANGENFLKDRGFRCISKGSAKNSKGGISFNGKVLTNTDLKPIIQDKKKDKKEALLWYRAHGSIYWTLGTESEDKMTLKKEQEAVRNFAKSLSNFINEKKINITAIVLDACDSGTEPLPDKPSSARLLSQCLKENNLTGIKVLGFFGTNTSATLTGLYDENGKPVHLSSAMGSVLFCDGKVIESPKQNLFLMGKNAHIPPFLERLGVSPQDYLIPVSSYPDLTKESKHKNKTGYSS